MKRNAKISSSNSIEQLIPLRKRWKQIFENSGNKFYPSFLNSSNKVKTLNFSSQPFQLGVEKKLELRNSQLAKSTCCIHLGLKGI